MSRYNATNDAGETFAYGYDEPLQDYFIQKDAPDEEAGYVPLVGSLSGTYGSGANLLAAIDEHKVQVPEDHRTAMVLDLPF